MADQNANQNQDEDITQEFVEFGRNIKKALQSAWESEERKKLQADIEQGLKEAGDALKQASNDFAHSQAAQTLKAEAEDIQKRVQSGEMGAKIRAEVLSALRIANQELKKAFSGGASSDTGSTQPPAAPEEK